MDFNRAAIFAAVVDANGFTAAARKLRLPKTTISKRVSDLEAELGIRLLNRTTRSLSLTEAGAKLYAHCRQALQTMEIAEREVHALQSEPEGLIRIGAPSAIGVRFLLPLIADLMAQYPALRISLIAINDDSGLNEDQLDVLIWPRRACRDRSLCQSCLSGRTRHARCPVRTGNAQGGRLHPVAFW
jgi:LysR family transcriptional regulator, regulator for bpeEF and oprC